MAEELGQLGDIFLCITAQVSTIPPDYKWVHISTLLVVAARDKLYRAYKHKDQSDPVNNISTSLSLSPCSLPLHNNRRDTNRLLRDWKRQRMGVLHTLHYGSLATTIARLPDVRSRRPRASRSNRLLPSRCQRKAHRLVVSDSLRQILHSLTCRSNGFIAMLAPLRGYLCSSARPRDVTPLGC